MKYIIKKKTEYKTYYDQEVGLHKSKLVTMYGAYRKGRIFGFWHEVGQWLTDGQGNNFCCEDWFPTEEKAIAYAECWHKETYGDKYQFELIY